MNAFPGLPFYTSTRPSELQRAKELAGEAKATCIRIQQLNGRLRELLGLPAEPMATGKHGGKWT